MSEWNRAIERAARIAARQYAEPGWHAFYREASNSIAAKIRDLKRPARRRRVRRK